MNDAERLKYHMARRCYREASKSGIGQRWVKWFKARYGESLDDYIAECQANGMRERVIAQEIEEFGWSPLQTSLTLSSPSSNAKSS